jgi:hypothetical protein
MTDQVQVEIEGTQGGVQRIHVHHLDGRAAAMRTLEGLLPTVKTIDRVLRGEPDPAPPEPVRADEATR